jgi:6-pyruvoyl-tetrahydropterin synthase related domain
MADGMSTDLDPSPDTDHTADAAASAQPVDRPDVVPQRSAMRRAWSRLVRRPVRWYRRPWTTERVVQVVTAIIVVGGATLAMLRAVQPGLVLTDNTPTGGDMGAHVMGPAYLRDALLGNLQLNGWSNYWYAGFPLYRFYMVTPALMIVLLDIVLPYGIAFKIVAVLGLLSLPAACWAFGRLARFRYPIPELMALAGLIFLFDDSFTIYGGNMLSTMAGEFAFSISLSLAILGLGLFARALQTGQYRCWAAIVIALSAVTHGIVLLFVFGGAFLLWLVWMDRRRFAVGLGVLGAAVMLSAFWVLPFLTNHEYMTDMKYGFQPNGSNESFWKMFFPWTPFLDVVVMGFAIVGFVASVARRNLMGAWLGITTLALFAAVYVARDSLPVIGLLWNPRVLPFLYLVRLLLMMVGVVELGYFLFRDARWVQRRPDGEVWVGAGIAAVTASVVAICLMFLFQIVPGGGFTTKNGQQVYAWGVAGWYPISLSPTASVSRGPYWAAYNFKGYEGRPTFGEYQGLVTTMDALGADPDHGCGRALWENNQAVGKYGTTMALMLLPHWTDGCIQSMEGLYFEASGTTPYHFISAAAVSESSSNPVRELRYDNLNYDKGVPYMQRLGVKYLMVFTQKAKDEAAQRPELVRVASSGPWNIYEVTESPLVEALDVQPVVVNERPGDQRERHLEVGTSWFQNPDDWAALPVDSGPDDWQRVDVIADPARDDGLEPGDPGRKVDVVVPVQPVEVVPEPAVQVSDVRLENQRLTFTVDQVGVPVLVKVSYFPNWQVSGADEVYRAAPNFMVVVPTDTEVTLEYQRSRIDYAAYLVTLLGVVFLVWWRRRGDPDLSDPEPLVRPDDTALDVTTHEPAGDVDDLLVRVGVDATPPDLPRPSPGDGGDGR